jgi:hypothetical protein
MLLANKSQASLPDDDAVFERRAKGRTTINRDALLFFEGQEKVHPCRVRDVTNDGAGIRLNAGLNIVLLEFGISFDRFRTMRKCHMDLPRRRFCRRGLQKLTAIEANLDRLG